MFIILALIVILYGMVKSSQSTSTSIGILIIFWCYLWILYFIVHVMGYFKEYDKIKYVPYFSSIIPIFFIFYMIYQTKDFDENDIGIIIISYTFVYVLTYLFLRETSSIFIDQFFGKEICSMGGDFSKTTLIFDYYSDNKIQLVKTTIGNILNYNLLSVNIINFKQRKYKIWHYSKKYPSYKWYKENVLLVELLVNTSETLEDIEEYDYIEDFEIVGEDVADYDLTHHFLFLYQFSDFGNSIESINSLDTELKLALQAMLPDDTLIFDYSKTDITPPEITICLYGLFEKYLTIKYGSLYDAMHFKIHDAFQGLRESHKRVLKYIVFFGLIFIILYSIFDFLNGLNISESATNSILIMCSILVLVPQFIPQFRRVINYISSDDTEIQNKRRNEKEKKP